MAAEPAAGKAVAATIEKLTGARTKIVWVRSVVDGKGHVDADDGIFYQLMVFDTHEAKERVLLPGPASCAYPWITGDGAHVVYTLLGGAGKVCVVDWDGTNRKELSDGFALTVWRDPASGIQWIYVGNNYAQKDYQYQNHSTAGITRYRLDNPSVKEPVWDKMVVEQRVALSGDGKRLGSGFPWPNQGVADLESGTWKQYGSGCLSSIAPDNSYRFFHMIGSHTEVIMYDDGGANRRTIPVNYKPGGMFWSPKWTNHVRFLTVAGPLAAGFGYAPGSNIHIGRFDEAFTKVEAWAQVSDGPVRDTHGYAWIETPEIRNSRKTDIPSLTAGLEAGSLGLLVKRLSQTGAAVRPVLEALKRISQNPRDADKAKEAQAIITHVEEWAKKELDRAKALETQNPAQAEKAYKNLATRFAGLEAATSARERLQDKAFQDDLRSWALVERIQAAEKRLKDVPGSERSAKDPKFARMNSLTLGQIKTAAQGLAQQGARPWILDEANGVLERCGLEPLSKPATAPPSSVPAAAAAPAPAAAGTSKQGDRTLKGTVSVADRVAPKLLSAVQIDDRRVLLTCSEPVRIDRAIVTRADGAPAVKLGLDSEGRGIIAEFAAPLAAKETLTVTGVTDRAQAPNEMAAAKAQIVRPDWPSNLAGLSYLWKNARTRDVIFDERIRLPVTTALNGGGQARFNREGVAMAAGGAFDPGPGSAERVLEGIKKTHQFSFEIVVASADLKQTKDAGGRPVSIFQWGNDWGEGIFWLFQEKNLLQVALGGESRGSQKVFEMATLPDTKPHHVIVSVAPKRLAFYLDGKKVKEIDPSPAQLLEVGAPPITFAGYRPDPGKKTWHGTFEYVAMYNRFIEEDEAAKNAAAVAADLAKRKTLPRIEVQATLIGKSKIPDPRQMAPYRNALIVNEYSVDKVLKGTYAGKTIRVAQWGMLDLKPTPLAALEPGASVKLVLETFADHDELVPELISDTLKEDFELKLYTDVNL